MLRRILLVLLVVVIVAAGAVYWFFSGDGIRRALEQQATAWLGQPVRIGTATGRLFPRIGLQLSDVRVGNPARVALADVEVSTGLRALLSRRVQEAEIILSNSRIDLPLPFSLPTSTSKAPSSSSTFTVASIDAISLRDVVLTSRGREIVVSADSSLNGNRLTLSRFTARSGETSVEASGVADLAPSVSAKLEASANQLDFDDLMALADAFTPPPQPTRRQGPIVPGRIEAKLSAVRGSMAGVDLGQLVGTVVARGNRVNVAPLSFELFGGKYTGGFDADLGSERMTVSLVARIVDIDVARLASFGGVPGAITGRMSGNGRVNGRGADFASVFESATGTGSATIADGTIRGLELVRTVVLFFGRPSSDAPEGSGARFDRIAATFGLSKQVVTTDSFVLSSRDVDVSGSGKLSIPTKSLDGRAMLMLSETLSAQAGTDLVRFTREENRVVLPAVLGGTLDKPRVTIDAAAAAKRGLRNEVERRLKGVFDRFKPPPQ